MGVNRDRILSKISYIKEQMNGIRQLLAEKEDQYILDDPWLIKGLKYSLQTSVEAVIDISYHIAAKVYNHAPIDARDAIRVLTEGGLVSREDVPTYNNMIEFRNRVVHGYQEVSPARVLEIAHSELSDFERFVCQIAKVLEKVDS